jgi:hypothetical protein
VIDPAPLLALRLALALLFASSARHKVFEFPAFRATFERYELVPRAVAGAAAALVPVAEVAAAGALVAAPGVGALLASALLALYAGAIAWNLWRGRRDIECGCGGPALRQTLSAALVARNLALVCGALTCALTPSTRALLWIDALSIAGGVCVLALLYAATNQLVANAPRLALLRGAP